MHPIFSDEWHGHFVVVVFFRPERAFQEPQKYDVTTGVKRFFLGRLEWFFTTPIGGEEQKLTISPVLSKLLQTSSESHVISTLKAAMNNEFLFMFYSAKTTKTKFDIQCKFQTLKPLWSWSCIIFLEGKK